jgi:peroxiredoxin Q/BCP
MGIVRSTFIIDEKGLLVQEYRKVKVKGHAEEVLEFVKSL